MHELEKKNGKLFTSKFVGTGPSSYEKRIYRATVSQRLRNTAPCHPLAYTKEPKALVGMEDHQIVLTSNVRVKSMPR